MWLSLSSLYGRKLATLKMRVLSVADAARPINPFTRYPSAVQSEFRTSQESEYRIGTQSISSAGRGRRCFVGSQSYDPVSWQVPTPFVQRNYVSRQRNEENRRGDGLSWSRRWYREFTVLLQRTKPDVVHIHNFFPLISPAVYYACRKANVPVVQTLHNYRLLCPAATFYRDGNVCEECLQHGLLRGVKYGCYQGSKLGTSALALMLQVLAACAPGRT